MKQNLQVGFEVGVADGFDFIFLGQKELEECLNLVDAQVFRALDFFFVVRYHRVKQGEKKVPLRFDYHVLRLQFDQNHIEARIRHERGTQRVQLDELTDFVIGQINLELTQRHLAPLIPRETDTVTVEQQFDVQ